MNDLRMYATGAATPVKEERPVAIQARGLHNAARLGGFEMSAVYALGGLAMNGSEALGAHRSALEPGADAFTCAELRRIQQATDLRAMQIIDRFAD